MCGLGPVDKTVTMHSAVPMDLFEQNWSTYRAVVQHDLMGHADLTAATALALRSWL